MCFSVKLLELVDVTLGLWKLAKIDDCFLFKMLLMEKINYTYIYNKEEIVAVLLGD